MKRKNKREKKMSISLILMTIWMFIASFSILSKSLNLSRFNLNVEILGYGIALFNYIMDLFILIGFVVFIGMFLKRKNNTWKYFSWFVLVLIVGEIFGFIMGILKMDKMVEVMSLAKTGLPLEFFVVTLVFTVVFHIIIYVLMIYFVRKNKNYFRK